MWADFFADTTWSGYCGSLVAVQLEMISMLQIGREEEIWLSKFLIRHTKFKKFLPSQSYIWRLHPTFTTFFLTISKILRVTNFGPIISWTNVSFRSIMVCTFFSTLFCYLISSSIFFRGFLDKNVYRSKDFVKKDNLPKA